MIKCILSAIVIFAVSLTAFSAFGVAINRIFLGNVDSALPVAVAAPTSVTGISASTDSAILPLWYSGSVIYGIDTADDLVKSSDLGVTWTDIDATPPWSTADGLGLTSTGRLVAVDDTGAACNIYYTDDEGGSYTTVALSGIGVVRCNARNSAPIGMTNIICASTTCVILGRNATPRLVIARSIDNGTTWSVAVTAGTNTCSGFTSGTNLFFFDGSILEGHASRESGGTLDCLVGDTTGGGSINLTGIGSPFNNWGGGCTTAYCQAFEANVNVTTSFWTTTTYTSWSGPATATFTPPLDGGGALGTSRTPMTGFQGYTTNAMYVCFDDNNSGVSRDLNVYLNTGTGAAFTEVFEASIASATLCGQFTNVPSGSVFFGTTAAVGGNRFFRIS